MLDSLIIHSGTSQSHGDCHSADRSIISQPHVCYRKKIATGEIKVYREIGNTDRKTISAGKLASTRPDKEISFGEVVDPEEEIHLSGFEKMIAVRSA